MSSRQTDSFNVNLRAMKRIKERRIKKSLVTVCTAVLYHHGLKNGCLLSYSRCLTKHAGSEMPFLEIKRDRMELLDKLAITRQSSRSSVH